MSKSDMARKLDISSQLYGQYENNQKSPKVDFAVKWKKVFGNDLFTNVETNVSRENSVTNALKLERKEETDLDLRTLIDSNNKLATAMMGCQEDQRELIQMLKEERKRNRPTERDPEQIDIALEKRLSDILMAVVEVGVGTKWKTRKEGIEELNRFLDGTRAGQTKADTRAAAHR